MQLTLLAAGTRMPAWVDQAVADYAKRFPRELALTVKPFPISSRRNGSPDSWRREEGRRILAGVPDGGHLVILDVRGKAIATPELRDWLERWIEQAKPVTLVIGGPDGLDESVQSRADQRWSLSPLTLPHALARVVVTEALYRAWSLRQGHPYHRA